MLCVANRPSFFLSAGNAAHGVLSPVQEDDIVIVLSKGVNTEELVILIDSLKQKNKGDFNKAKSRIRNS